VSVGFGFLVDFAVAILVAWVAFVLIPAPAAPPVAQHDEISYSDTASTAMELSIVVAPLMAGFLIFGWTSILVLFYGVLFATAMSSSESARMGWKSPVANLIFGGAGMLIVYGLPVMVPSLAFMVVLMFFAIMIYSNRIFSSSRNAALWASGLFGFLLLLGPALLSNDVDAGVKITDRVLQLGLATVYVVFAFRVVDLFSSYCSDLRARLRSQNVVSMDRVCVYI